VTAQSDAHRQWPVQNIVRLRSISKQTAYCDAVIAGLDHFCN